MRSIKLRTLGSSEAELGLGMIENMETSITRREAARRMSTSIGGTDQTLRRLVSKGWLARAGNGVYLIQPAELGSHPLPESEAYALLNSSEPEAIVAYGTAAALWGLTTQLRHEIVAVSPKRSWKRQMGPVLLNRLCRFLRDDEKLEVTVKNVRGLPVRVFSLEKTAIDCLETPSLCGGVQEAHDILVTCSRKWNWVTAKSILERNGRVATMQRIGFLLDIANIRMPDDFRAWLLSSIPSNQRIYLVSGRDGKFNRQWRVIA